MQKKIFVSLGLLSALLVAGLLIYKARAPKINLDPVQAEKIRLSKIFDKDRQNLTDPKTSPSNFSGSLLRLAMRGDPLAKDAAMKQSFITPDVQNLAATEALGFFEDAESTAKLSSLLKSKDEKFRIAALNGLSKTPRRPDREKIVDAFLRQPGNSSLEMVWAKAALLKLSSSRAGIDWAVKQLLNSTGSFDSESELLALKFLLELAPQSPDLRTKLKNSLEEKTSDSGRALAIRHLASLKDPDLLKKLDNLYSSTSEEVRQAVVQSLHQGCPANRKDLLMKWILLEKTPLLREVILREPSLIGGIEGLDLAKLLQQTMILNPQDREVITNVVQQMEKNLPPAICP
jgi:hypothetical protein